MRRFRPGVESCESRVHPTMVFIFPGNALAAANPMVQTQTAAIALAAHGDQPIQVATPAINGPGVFHQIAAYVRRVSHGQPIGLMGFSAGGALALRLAGQPGLNVKAVMNFYGPPDLKDWLASHGHDSAYQYVVSHVRLTPAVIRLLSGPTSSNAYFVSAFGLHDTTVGAVSGAASFQRDFPQGKLYYYDGPHGVTLAADPAAYRDFVDHL